MSGQTLIIALQGFKIRPETLGSFLAKHGDSRGTGNGRYAPRYHYDETGAASDAASDILRARAAEVRNGGRTSGILVVVPSVHPHDRSPWVYVAHSHDFVYSQRLIPAEDLEKGTPLGFAWLMYEILNCSSNLEEEGSMGFYIVASSNRSAPIPAELRERRKVPIHCGICEKTFGKWEARQRHRFTVHQLDEDLNVLPENA